MKANAKEEALVERLLKLNDKELAAWMRSRRKFDPEVNVGVVGLELMRRGRRWQ